MKSFTILLFAALLLAGTAQACDLTGAYIINLSQDEADKAVLDICTGRDSDSEVRECIKTELRIVLPRECRGAIDIFVPGSNQEFGAWKQFNYLFNTDNDRAHLSVQYQDAREADNDLKDFDLAAYDQGVLDALESLTHLLEAIRTATPSSGMGYGTKVRVFGHSKGSHAVALAAENPRFAHMEFYAFAQAGRTERDISARVDIRPAKRGTPGYIHKLSENLVGITWENDEVRYMFGNDLTAGIEVPEIWGFPGYIKDTGTDGTSPILAEAFRIDHHNNYGGNYTDGLSGNDWRDGEGSRDKGWPYCATGDKIAWDSGECDETDVTFKPWFWGHPECRAETFRMMKSGAVGERYYIGNSGPRDRRSCRESERRMTARYTLRYRYNVPDKDCIHRVIVRFRDLDGRQTGAFTVNGTTDNDEKWLSATGDVVVPLHMKLELDVDLLEDAGSGTCDAFASNESEVWIDYLRLSISEPGTARGITRSIIGYREGRGAIRDLDEYSNTAWVASSGSQRQFDMEYSTTFNSIKIEANAEAPKSANFEKRVHLVD